MYYVYVFVGLLVLLVFLFFIVPKIRNSKYLNKYVENFEESPTYSTKNLIDKADTAESNLNRKKKSIGQEIEKLNKDSKQINKHLTKE